MNWITLKDFHFNLDNIAAFQWRKCKLYLFDGISVSPYMIDDRDKKWYSKLCNAYCMNMAEPTNAEELND